MLKETDAGTQNALITHLVGEEEQTYIHFLVLPKTKPETRIWCSRWFGR